MTATRQDDPGTTDVPTPPPEPHARRWRGRGWGFVVKLLVMMTVNAIGIMAILSAFAARSWIVLAVLVLLLALADWIYFARRALPLKYLRSEERRVGKECGSRWWAKDGNKRRDVVR